MEGWEKGRREGKGLSGRREHEGEERRVRELTRGRKRGERYWGRGREGK